MEGGFFLWRVEFLKIGKRDFMFIREMRVDGLILGKHFEKKIHKIKSKITIWQPSNKTEGKEWHDCMMDHLKFGYISEFLCCNEENSIQKFKGF